MQAIAWLRTSAVGLILAAAASNWRLSNRRPDWVLWRALRPRAIGGADELLVGRRLGGQCPHRRLLGFVAAVFGLGPLAAGVDECALGLPLLDADAADVGPHGGDD